ncbi:KH domain-containing protein HEN4-like [Phalaenopsis equestris]|uniref:KH domain-containing protein HEN4-like n=1 Tax=Phalaenopsis equestris TaxID=78828 RepID=UPI0009E27AC7|nr:KH domain-containing protein HEN4-like [Phalaenopsis equestris]XP_020576944.1 KH domain-containing protein HEN4-like [Phalaenopsis equestris]
MDEERNYCRKRYFYADNSVEDEGCKRRSLVGQRELQDLTVDHTVYRYLCPKRKAGHVIGRGGEIMKYIRADTGARVLIEDAMQGCDERIVTISSSSKETNPFNYKKDYACPAQDALFRVHERLAIHETMVFDEDDVSGVIQITVRLLVPSDQARCIIGRHGHTIKNMRKDTGARISIWNDKRIPICANSNEELLEIRGDALVAKEALFQISCLLHEFPSRSHNYMSSKVSYNTFGCNLVRDPGSPVEDEFILRLVCPSVNIRDVIGKGGANINQIRQESGATINLDCFFDEEDCMILISAKEFMGISNSPTINAATQLQLSCSSKVDGEYDGPSYVTRLLVLRSQLGGLIGKGGLFIKEMRRTTKTSISIVEDSLPSVAAVDDAMVEICGDLPNVRDALIQVINRLKISHFARKGLVSASPSASSHHMLRNSTHGSLCSGRSFELHSHGHSHSSEYKASVGRVSLEIHAGSDGPQVDSDN